VTTAGPIFTRADDGVELARRGFDAWVAELRGHGRSGPAARREVWPLIGDWLESRFA
jgi:alpha-beta hydrolase superfamily lysophospholipase